MSAVLLSIALTSLGATGANPQDLEKMQGDWMVSSMTAGGMQLPDSEAESLFRTVEGQEYTVSRYSKVAGRGTFKIDAAVSPRTIDSQPAGDANSTKAILGIYEFDGQKLRICNAPPGKPRPKAFESTAANGNTLIVWEPERK